MPTVEDIEDATSKCMLPWACRVDVQREQKSALNDMKEAKEFVVIKHNAQKQKCVKYRVQK